MTATLASKASLAGLSKAELAEKLIAVGVEPKKAKMRVEQVWHWIYHYGVTDFGAMTNVAKELRATLAEDYTLERPEIVTQQVSTDGTRKWLIRLGPGVEAEAVFIPGVGKAGALCVSSQVGCTLNCTCCHTGTQKLVRNLTSAEIVPQVMIARDAFGEWPPQVRPLNDGDRQHLSTSTLAQRVGLGNTHLPGVTLLLPGQPDPAATGLRFVDDNDRSSEQNVIDAGDIALSLIQGNHQAAALARAMMRVRLQGLVK